MIKFLKLLGNIIGGPLLIGLALYLAGLIGGGSVLLKHIFFN